MKIEFPDGYTKNQKTGGINFPVSVDGKNIVCQVSNEALEDINPPKKFDSIETRFKENKSDIQLIAEQKIRNGESNIFISSDDVLK
jgi:hypothetical protein